MNVRKDTKWLINKSKSIFGDLFDYSETSYTNAKTKITFRCKKHNHKFYQTSNNHFYSKYPCKYCKKEYLSKLYALDTEEFKDRVKLIYGSKYDLQQVVYKNQKNSVKIRCKDHNYIFEKLPELLLKGHGCPKCTKEKFQLEHSSKQLEEIKTFIEKFNGKCLSTKYIDNTTNMQFKCEHGHKFWESWSDIKNALRWCPKCSSNKLIGESIARQILEHLLQIKFPSTFIPELQGLQLDGYNKKHKIAFEYQGYQHYTIKSHFQNSSKDYKAQLERDNKKKELCKKEGITLLEILEFKTIRKNRIRIFYDRVFKVVKKVGLEYVDSEFKLDLVDLFRGKTGSLYEKAKTIVNGKGGFLQDYIGSESKHYFICSNGHKIENRVLSVIIKSKAECPKCIANNKYLELKAVIENRGGKLIDKKIKPRGFSESYQWVCDKGHTNKSKGANLIKGIWCKLCQYTNKKINLSKSIIEDISRDTKSGKYYQKDIVAKYGLSDSVFRRIIFENKITPFYLPQDRTIQIKRTKGRLYQIDPKSLEIIKIFESLESVKKSPTENFNPGGIRKQMKKNRKAYGYYWSREQDFIETIRILKLNNH